MMVSSLPCLLEHPRPPSSSRRTSDSIPFHCGAGTPRSANAIRPDSMSKEGTSPTTCPWPRPVLILAVSVLLLIPCFWHRRIEAGDLPSHVYNAWLAQLIGQGQAPGL